MFTKYYIKNLLTIANTIDVDNKLLIVKTQMFTDKHDINLCKGYVRRDFEHKTCFQDKKGKFCTQET